jgi:NAD-dependent deacetylase
MIEKAGEIIRSSKHLIALTGAGISNESNVPTFRGKDGLWRNYDPMQLATPSAFVRNPSLVWEWYSWRQGLIKACSPNPAHTTLASWEKRGLLKSLITQNVDGLHRRAGSETVLEVHGDLWAIKCTSCSFHSRLSEPVSDPPKCPECGQLLRPNVVWFGESLDPLMMSRVYDELSRADVILVVGTSALIQPAASFPLIVRQNGGLIVEVNVERTPLTVLCEVHINGKAGEILPRIAALL